MICERCLAICLLNCCLSVPVLFMLTININQSWFMLQQNFAAPVLLILVLFRELNHAIFALLRTCTFYPCSDPNIRGCTQFSCPQSARWLVRPNRVLSRNQAFQRRIPYLSRVEKRPQLGFVPHLQKKRTVLGSKNTRPNFTVVM